MIERLNERLETFKKDKTYTFLKDIFNIFFNGYIKKIESKRFLFIDDELGEIWINKEDIVNINFSKKNIGERRLGK